MYFNGLYTLKRVGAGIVLIPPEGDMLKYAVQIDLSVSHPRSWYARWSYLVTVVFLKKSVSSGISPSTIFVAPQVGEEEAAITVLSVPVSCPESSALAD
jgi:hypothetical protein